MLVDKMSPYFQYYMDENGLTFVRRNVVPLLNTVDDCGGIAPNHPEWPKCPKWSELGGRIEHVNESPSIELMSTVQMYSEKGSGTWFENVTFKLMRTDRPKSSFLSMVFLYPVAVDQ
jgi:hypothetical protein